MLLFSTQTKSSFVELVQLLKSTSRIGGQMQWICMFSILMKRNVMMSLLWLVRVSMLSQSSKVILESLWYHLIELSKQSLTKVGSLLRIAIYTLPAVLAEDFANLGIDTSFLKYPYVDSLSLTWPSHTVTGISTFYIFLLILSKLIMFLRMSILQCLFNWSN